MAQVRWHEKEVLAGLGDLARSGNGQLVLMSGLAGIGKSFLLDWAAEQWAISGGAVVRGAGIPGIGKELPFVPWLQALAAKGHGAAGSAQLAAACAELDHPFQDGAPPRVVSFWRQLVSLSDQSPLLIQLDDGHWLDASSLGLLAAGLTEVSKARIFVMLAFRSSAVEESPLQPLRHEWSRMAMCKAMSLKPLSDEAMSEVLGAGAGEVPAGLLARAGGNPFFGLGLLRAWKEHGELRLSGTLLDLLQAQLTAAPPKVQQICKIIALDGDRTDPAILALALGKDEVKTEGLVLLGVRQGLLAIDEQDGTVRTAHPLIAEAARQSVGPALQKSIARTLALAYESAEPRSAGSIKQAVHWREAGEPGRAVSAYLEAAEGAGKLGAYPEQWEHFRNALALTEQLPEDARNQSPAVLLRDAAEAAYLAGDADSAVVLAKRTLQSAELRDADRISLLERLVHYLRLKGEGEGALGAARSARDLASETAGIEVALRAEVAATYGSQLASVGDHGSAEEVAQETLSISKQITDGSVRRRVEASALTTVGVAHALRGDLGPALSAMDEALAIGRTLPGGEGELRVLNNRCFVLQEAGRFEEAASDALEGLLLSRERHLNKSTSGLLLANLVGCLDWLGRWGEAMKHIEEGLEQVSAPEIRAGLLSTQANILAFHGKFDAARDIAARASREARGSAVRGVHNQLLAIEAEVELLTGAPTRVLDIVAAGLTTTEDDADDPDAFHLATLGFLALPSARLTLAPEDLEAKTGFVDRFEHLAHEVSPAGPLVSAWKNTCRAAAAAAAARRSAELWMVACTEWERLNNPVWTARCLTRAAEASLRENRPEAARKLTRSIEISRGIGATVLVEEAEFIGRQAGLRLTESHRNEPLKPSPAPFGLTPRELEVLLLVMVGLTNRLIARTLFISERTAGVHVANVLHKLGAANRGEAAALAYRMNISPNVDGLT